jgi:hypothetical protein
MTLDHVFVDCHQVNRPGQLGVAIGRAKSLSGLQIINFTPACCVKQPQCISDFYNSIAPGRVADDLSCCRPDIHDEETDEETGDVDELPPAQIDVALDENSEGEFDADPSEEELMELDQMVIQATVEIEEVQMPADFNLHQFVDSVKYDNVYTPFQANVNSILSRLQTVSIDNAARFLAHEWLFMQNTFTAATNTGQVQQKDETQAYASIYQHTVSLEYKVRCKGLFASKQVQDVTPEEWDAAFLLCTGIRKLVLSATADQVQRSKPKINLSRRLPSEGMTSGGRGKVRYVVAYCFAKVRYNHQQSAKRLIHKLDAETRNKIQVFQAKALLLSSVCRTESQIMMESEDHASLNETTRKQNISQGLTHITDKAYEFGELLTEEVIKMQSTDNLFDYGENLHHFVLHELWEANCLWLKFLDLFHQEDELNLGSIEVHREVLIKDVFKEITCLFSKVMMKQMRKDYLAEVKKGKKPAHRKKVLQSTVVTGTADVGTDHRKLDYTFLQRDESADKQQSHKKIQDYINQYQKLPPFTKPQLQTLCRVYAIPFIVRHTKAALSNMLLTELPQKNSMSKPDLLSDADVIQARQGRKRTMEQGP